MKKFIRAVIVVTLLFVLLAAPAYAQGPVPPEDLTPLAAWLLLVTIFLPLVNAGVKRLMSDKSKEAQSAVVFIVCVLAGLGQAYFNGSLEWANGDPQAIASVLVVNVAVVVTLAFAWYKMFWQAVGIDAKISGQ